LSDVWRGNSATADIGHNHPFNNYSRAEKTNHQRSPPPNIWKALQSPCSCCCCKFICLELANRRDIHTCRSQNPLF